MPIGILGFPAVFKGTVRILLTTIRSGMGMLEYSDKLNLEEEHQPTNKR